MASIGEQMGHAARAQTRRLPLDERLRLAIQTGELAIEAYRAVPQVDRATQFRDLEAERQRGRRPCRLLANAPN
jgi:hypothetical protein